MKQENKDLRLFSSNQNFHKFNTSLFQPTFLNFVFLGYLINQFYFKFLSRIMLSRIRFRSFCSYVPSPSWSLKELQLEKLDSIVVTENNVIYEFMSL